MPTLEQETNAARVSSRNSTSSAGSTGYEVAKVGQTVTSFSGEGKDAVFGIGTNAANKWLQNTEAYQAIKNSKRAEAIRGSDASIKFTKANKGVDDFFTRMKDKSVAKFKGVYQWSKAKLHIGKDAQTITGNVPAGVDASVMGVPDGTVVNAGGAAVNTENVLIKATAAGGGTTIGETGIALRETVTKAPTMFGKLLGGLGKIGAKLAIPFTLAVGAFETKNALQEHDGHKAAKAAGATMGGILGGIAMGAAEGVVVGALLTGPLAFAGSLVLGIAGAVVGGYVGSKATDKAIGNRLQAHLDKGSKLQVAPTTVHETSVAMNGPDVNEPESMKHRMRIMQERQAMAQQTSPVHS